MAVVETEQVGALVEAARTEQRGLWWDAWRWLKQNPAALAGAAYVLLMLVIAVVAPLLAPYNPDYIPPTARANAPPFWMAGHDPRYLLGTDNLARDEWSRSHSSATACAMRWTRA